MSENVLCPIHSSKYKILSFVLSRDQNCLLFLNQHIRNGFKWITMLMNQWICWQRPLTIYWQKHFYSNKRRGMNWLFSYRRSSHLFSIQIKCLLGKEVGSNWICESFGFYRFPPNSIQIFLEIMLRPDNGLLWKLEFGHLCMFD